MDVREVLFGRETPITVVACHLNEWRRSGCVAHVISDGFVGIITPVCIPRVSALRPRKDFVEGGKEIVECP